MTLERTLLLSIRDSISTELLSICNRSSRLVLSILPALKISGEAAEIPLQEPYSVRPWYQIRNDGLDAAIAYQSRLCTEDGAYCGQQTVLFALTRRGNVPPARRYQTLNFQERGRRSDLPGENYLNDPIL